VIKVWVLTKKEMCTRGPKGRGIEEFWEKLLPLQKPKKKKGPSRKKQRSKFDKTSFTGHTPGSGKREKKGIPCQEGKCFTQKKLPAVKKGGKTWGTQPEIRETPTTKIRGKATKIRPVNP